MCVHKIESTTRTQLFQRKFYFFSATIHQVKSQTTEFQIGWNSMKFSWFSGIPDLMEYNGIQFNEIPVHFCCLKIEITDPS